MSSYEYNHAMARTTAPIHIYGVTWDGSSSTALTRTDDAANFSDPVPYVAGATSYGSPFDNLMPWKGMVKVEDSEAGTLVEIPKFWYKLTKDGSALSIQIADKETEGFSVSPAHMDRGDGAGERDVVYIGRYHCGSTNYKSVTGVSPKVSITRSTARTAIHNLGTTIWQSDFAMRFTIWLLYIVEFADWDSQKTIGYGCGNGTSLQSAGLSDSIPYHTGRWIGGTDYCAGVQYRWIEGLWDSVNDWVDGCVSSSYFYLILKPSSFSDNTNSDAIRIGTPVNGYPTALTVYRNSFPLFLSGESQGGSNTTFIPDYWSYSNSAYCIRAGGYYSNENRNAGLFYIGAGYSDSTYIYVGCRLMKLP